MNSSRSYRAALSEDEIRHEFQANVDSQFDGDVVRALFDILNMTNNALV